jgi:hypothetical protein
MPTTRTEVMQAIELAALVLPAADAAANFRESFVELMGLDPATVGQGRGRRAARILGAVLAALRQQDAAPILSKANHGSLVPHAVVDGDQPDQRHGEESDHDERGPGGREMRHEGHGAHQAVRHHL